MDGEGGLWKWAAFLQKAAVGKLERLRTPPFPAGWVGSVGWRRHESTCSAVLVTRVMDTAVLAILGTGVMGMVWQVLPQVLHLLRISCILCPLALAAFLPVPRDSLAALSLHP